MDLLAATLSKRGYEKVLAIVEGDEALKAASGGRGGAMFGRDLFYISILGKPSGGGSLDAAVRRPSPGVEYYGGGTLPGFSRPA